MSSQKEQTFEQCMMRLEQVIRQMESGKESLETSMALFEEGNRLARKCATMLDQAEQTVTRLISAQSGEELPFQMEE